MDASAMSSQDFAYLKVRKVMTAQEKQGAIDDLSSWLLTMRQRKAN